MIFQLFAVYDRVALTYLRPFITPAIGPAVRNFVDEVNRSDQANPLFVHPDDYVLRVIGTYDDETAKISQSVEPFDVSDGAIVKIR